MTVGIVLAFTAVGFIDKYTWRGHDQSLSCLHSAHSGSRCMTTAVLGPDLRGPALVASGK